MKLKTLRSTLPRLEQKLRPVPTLSEQRISGSILQRRRLNMWKADPHCAKCGRVVEYPQGFELDHKVRLEDGGPDTEDNCQILCVYTEAGLRLGCHAEKTRKENAKAHVTNGR